MSQWAKRRQRRLLFIIGLLVLIVLGLIIFSLTNKQPTCFDRIQNGSETGVDCGGGCQNICLAEAHDIVVWWERPFKVANGVYNVVAYFENQNLDAGIKDLAYEFRLYNKNNILVSEPIVGSTFIEPNKRSAIFEPGIQTGQDEAYTVFFKTSVNKTWEKIDNTYAFNLFQVGEPVLTNQEVAPKLQAPIKNVSLENFREVPVIAIIYNQKGNAIASSRTFVDEIKQGGTANVYFSWPEPFNDTVSKIEIIPRVDPFVSKR